MSRSSGRCDVRLWVSSSAVDTDFVAKLVDVYPPSADYPEGYALLLSEGILRMRYRDDRPVGERDRAGRGLRDRARPPADRQRIQARPPHPPGCLELGLSRVRRNPNTGEPLGEHTHTVVAHQTLYHDAVRPLQIVLPVQSGNLSGE